MHSRSALACFSFATLVAGCGSTSATSAPAAESAPPAESDPAPVAPPPATTPGDVAAASSASNRFTGELYRALARPAVNTVISPFSVHTAFAMVREGSVQGARREFDQVLHLEGDAVSNLRALSDRVAALGRSGVELRVANRVFVESSLHVEPAFTAALTNGFGAPFEAVDFVGASEAARVHVNTWVEGQTASRITDLLPPHSVDSDTRMVLTNAVYFHGSWATRFEPSRTQPRPFTLAQGTSVEVPMMQASLPLRFGRASGVTLGELPYVGGDVAMLLVVPDAPTGLAQVVASLSEETIRTWVDALAERPEVRVSLPRFRVAPTESVRLKDAMVGLGLVRAFDPQAGELSGIANVTPPLFVQEGYHRAFIEVNEEGTEAAAATAVVVATRGASMGPPVDALQADRPFLFLLRDRVSGAILFVGHVADPR